MPFSPERLTLARQRRGMNKTQLAGAVGVSTKTVSMYEKGDKQPPPPTLARIASALDFPAGFFSAFPVDPVTVEGTSFRALSRMTASKRDAARAAGTLCTELNAWFDSQFDLPEPRVPQSDPAVQDPEAAAETVRAEWGLGNAPVPNLVHLLELHGVRVFSLAEECREIDAFSFRHEGTPFVCLNTTKTAERGRFDAAHELGHLVLHRGHDHPRGRGEEHQADAFASAFLMPRTDVIASVRRQPDFADIVHLKKRWNVSAAALNYRLHKLNVTTDWHYRAMCIELSRYGRHEEPVPGPREQSQLLDKAFAALRAEGITRAMVAAALHVYPKDLDALVFGLVMSSVDGGGQQAPPASTPHLRLV